MIEIIIPAYNCTDTLSKTLGSLVTQIDPNFKVHIVDDCSTEDLNPIIDKFKPLLDIKVTRNEVNLGCGMTRQVGIDNATGDYIAFLDSDDILMPWAIESWNITSKSSPETDIFHAHFYEQEIIDNKPVLIYVDNGYTWTHGKLYKLDFIRKNNIRNNPAVRWADDSFFNSMCTELGKISIIKFPLYLWINNKNSITRCGKLNERDMVIDFINAMIISTEFLKSKGIKNITHATKTIESMKMKNIEKYNNDDIVMTAYNRLKQLFNNE